MSGVSLLAVLAKLPCRVRTLIVDASFVALVLEVEYEVFRGEEYYGAYNRQNHRYKCSRHQKQMYVAMYQ